MAFLPAAALMFRRGDLASLPSIARLTIPAAQVVELTADNVSMQDAWRKAGVSTSDLLTHRLQLQFARGGKLEAKLDSAVPSPASWDAKAGVYSVDAPAAKVLVGRCTGKSTSLNGVEFNVSSNPRNFAVITLDAVDAQPVGHSHRLLLAAAGDVENTGMIWNLDRTSVGTHWGRAPTICEGIAAKVSITTSAKTARVYALDGKGSRAREVPAKLEAGKLSFEIGPQFQTLWYEILLGS